MFPRVLKASCGRCFEAMHISYISSDFCLFLPFIGWSVSINFISFSRVFVINIWLSESRYVPYKKQRSVTEKSIILVSVTLASVHPNFQGLNTTEAFLPGVSISGCGGGFLPQSGKGPRLNFLFWSNFKLTEKL